MQADVVFLPGNLRPIHLERKSVVVFDVLRATTTMIAALAVEVREIQIFGGTQEAAQAAAQCPEPRPLLCGEVRCLPPAGFDLGNSPGLFGPTHAGRMLFMATTNGTRAIVAARSAAALFAGALVNAGAVAQRLVREGRDATLLCAGTDGAVAMEDVIGCGAVLDALEAAGNLTLASDAAKMALRLFRAAKGNLREALADAAGGRNVLEAQRGEDLEFAAQLNLFDLVGVVRDRPLRVEPR